MNRSIFSRKKESQRGSEDRIQAIQGSDSILTSQNEIEAAFTQAYKDLFEYGSSTCDRELLQKYAATWNAINDETKQQTGECISETEIEWTIRKLKARKSSGVDGLYSACYKKIQSELLSILNDVHDDLSKRGLLPAAIYATKPCCFTAKETIKAITVSKRFSPH